jgi:transposase InsO family protein
MAWKGVKVSEQRLRFVLRASSGDEEMAGLCREFGISRPTGYHWLKRYRGCDQVQELAEKSRRPQRSPRQTESQTEDRVVEERKRRPDWGARKLQVLLRRDGIGVARSTIHRILQRHDLIRARNQHRPALQRFQRERPNQLWQMDFKGLPENLSNGCTPLSVVDDCSRYAVGLEGLAGTQGRAVRETLERIFRQDGVPDGMLMDHGTPWWSAHHVWGWTQLSIWLMKQGIELHYSAIRHPQTQGKVERFHRSMQEALGERGYPRSLEQWRIWLEEFRQEYNQVRPHEALQMATPASRWVPSTRAFQEKPAEWEYPVGSRLAQIRRSGQIQVDHQEYTISGALAGEWVQLQPQREDRLLVYYRRTCIREIDLQKRTSYPVYYGKGESVFEND